MGTEEREVNPVAHRAEKGDDTPHTRRNGQALVGVRNAVDNRQTSTGHGRQDNNAIRQLEIG